MTNFVAASRNRFNSFSKNSQEKGKIHRIRTCNPRQLFCEQGCLKNCYLQQGFQCCILCTMSYLYLLECQNYQAITDNYGRKNTYVTSYVHCDSTLGPGWFRFQEATGTKMPTSCVPTNRCNTRAPGWLNGAHPTVADGQVTRQVCFHYFSNCCNWSINIQVRNCGGYFVYYFSGTPSERPCALRFCSSD